MIVDLFAGAGGWAEGLKLAGCDQTVVGLDTGPDACATSRAAGHLVLRADVTAYPPEAFADVDGLVASPPCQDWSQAGRGAGYDGETGALVDEPMRWIRELKPRWVAMEQVPPVLAVWRSHAHTLRQWGYAAWAGKLCAADYGVPQTRTRAILIARRDGGPCVPGEPTHDEHGPTMLLDGRRLEPWVAMAQALGWGEFVQRRDSGPAAERPPRGSDEPSYTIRANGSGAAPGGVTLHTNRDQRPDGSRQTRPADAPAPSVTTKAGGQWQFRGGSREKATVRDVTEPAPTLAFGHDHNGTEWVDRPSATTVQADPRVGRPATTLVTSRRSDRGGLVGHSLDEGAVKVTPVQAGVLQGFPADFPWQGSKTSKFRQIGNAIPPALAAAVVTGLVETREVAA